MAVEATLGDRLGGVLVERAEVGLAAIGFSSRPAVGAARSSGSGRSPGGGTDVRGEGGRRAGFVGVEGKMQVEDRSSSLRRRRGRAGRMSDLVGFADGLTKA